MKVSVLTAGQPLVFLPTRKPSRTISPVLVVLMIFSGIVLLMGVLSSFEKFFTTGPASQGSRTTTIESDNNEVAGSNAWSGAWVEE